MYHSTCTTNRGGCNEKRLLSVLLAGVMVFSQSGAVLAAENSGAGDTAIAIVEEEAQSEGREEAPEEDSANEAGQNDDAQEPSGAESAGEEDSDVTDQKEDETAQRLIRARMRMP